MVLVELVIPTAIYCPTYGVDRDCFHIISCRMFLSDTMYFTLKNNVVILTSAADDTTYFMICTIVSS